MRLLPSYRRDTRSGIATVEAAVSLPLLLVLVFGAIEASNAIFLKQSLTIAAYEAAKIASKNGGTSDAAQTRCEEVLSSRGFVVESFSTSPSNITRNTQRGRDISVTVSVSASSGAIGPLWIYGNKILTKTVHMVRL